MTYRKTRKTKHNPHINARPLTPEQVERALGGSVLVKPRAPLSGGAQEAKAILDKATQLKGTTMPDIKTALSTALETGKRQALNATLDAWEQDEKETQLEKPVLGKKHLFEITNNVSRETFNYVRDNPRSTMAEIKKGMEARGYNPTSVGSLLTQFTLQQHISRDDRGQYTIVHKEYQSLMTRAKWIKLHGSPAEARAEKRQAKLREELSRVKRKYVKRNDNAQAVGIGALPVQEKKPEVTSILLTRNWTAQGVVDKLTVVQARQLYDLLKQIFGG